jgi:putative oxidoreductase
MSTLAPRARQVADQVRATERAELTRDVALLVVRILLAWIFIYHGGRTLFGLFGGPGVSGTTVFFANVAHLHPAKFFAVLSGIIEFFGGIAVGVGFLGRLAAAALVGDMVIAMATVTWHNGITSAAVGGGYELNLALLGMAVVIALLGTGRFSLDVAVPSLLSKGRPPR